jgi:hypothetical protein
MEQYQTWLAHVAQTIPDIARDPLDEALHRTFVEPDALLLEFGVFSGRTTRRIAAAFPNHDVFGFDSFRGLPERWRDGYEAGAFDTHGEPPSDLPDNVTIVTGLFEETLPAFVRMHGHRPLGLVHIDCDIYASTATVFRFLGPMFRDGTCLVFDEAFNYPHWQHHEIKALYEFLMENPQWTVEWLGKQGPVLEDNTENPYQQAACILRKKHVAGVVAGTLIYTPTGPVPIQNLHPGDRILTAHMTDAVVDCVVPQQVDNHPVRTVDVFHGFKELVCALDQPIAIFDKTSACWTPLPAVEVRRGDRLGFPRPSHGLPVRLDDSTATEVAETTHEHVLTTPSHETIARLRFECWRGGALSTVFDRPHADEYSLVVPKQPDWCESDSFLSTAIIHVETTRYTGTLYDIRLRDAAAADTYVTDSGILLTTVSGPQCPAHNL